MAKRGLDIQRRRGEGLITKSMSMPATLAATSRSPLLPSARQEHGVILSARDSPRIR